MEAVRPLNRLPREIVDAPSPEVPKVRLDEALSNQVKDVPAHGRGVETRCS